MGGKIVGSNPASDIFLGISVKLKIFFLIPTASSASLSLGTRLLRPDLGPHQGGFLPKQVEPYTRVHSSVSARLSLLLSWVAYSSLKIALVYLYYLSRQQQCKNRSTRWKNHCRVPLGLSQPILYPAARSSQKNSLSLLLPIWGATNQNSKSIRTVRETLL